MIYYIFAGDYYYPSVIPGDLIKGFQADSDEEAIEEFRQWGDQPEQLYYPDKMGKLIEYYAWAYLLRGDEELTIIAPK